MEIIQQERTPNETVLQCALERIRENNRTVINEIKTRGATPSRKLDLKKGLQCLNELNRMVAGDRNG